MTTTLNLEARRHTSRVLDAFIQSRPGAASRVLDESVLQPVHNAVVYRSSSDADAINALFAPIPAASGYSVNDKTAMAVAAVYACLTKLAGAVVQLPIHHYRVDTKTQEPSRAAKEPLWWMLNERPHNAWTSASWKDWIVRCVHLRGDQHTEIVRSSNASGGVIKGLNPLHPDLVVPRHVQYGNSYRLVYDCVDPFTGKVRTIDQDDMLHFTGFGFDGLRSLSVIQHAAKQAIGNSLAAADYSGRTMGEGGMPRIALTYPGIIGDEQAKSLRTSFLATYGTPGSQRLPLVLTEGGTVKELTLSPVDLQLIEARSFEKQDIFQAMGVPPVIVGDNEKASSWGTGIEQIMQGFVRFTIKPHLVRWEEELNSKIFRNSGQYLEFELDGLLRGDSKTQSEVFKAALGGPGSGDGYMTINEVRRLKNLPSVEGGNELYKAPRDTSGATPPPAGAPA